MRFFLLLASVSKCNETFSHQALCAASEIGIFHESVFGVKFATQYRGRAIGNLTRRCSTAIIDRKKLKAVVKKDVGWCVVKGELRGRSLVSG
jgi:hypothetical protein